MKNSIKIAFVAAVAIAGIAACTPSENAAPVIATETSTPTGTSTSAQSNTVVTETVTSTVVPPGQQAIAKKIDNRPGFDALKLGMTLAEANATGQSNLNWGREGDSLCVADNKVAISKKYGVERITLPADAKTSAGIGIGSTFADVKKAYPAATEYRAGYSVALQGYGYAFQSTAPGNPYKDTDKVVSIKLTANVVDCSFSHL